MAELAWGRLATPVGELSVACGGAGVARVSFGPPPRGAAPGAAAVHAEALRQLGEYFAGSRRAFSLPVDLSEVSGARQRVLLALLDSVGYGQTITYGSLARLAGVAGGGRSPAARVVGQIMGSNPVPLIVPCHRVVAGDGLGGYSGGAGVEIKRWLLTFEGAIPATLDWDPSGLPAALR